MEWLGGFLGKVELYLISHTATAIDSLRTQSLQRKRLFISSFVFFFYIFTVQLFRFVRKRQAEKKILSSSLEEACNLLYRRTIAPLERKLGLRDDTRLPPPSILILGNPEGKVVLENFFSEANPAVNVSTEVRDEISTSNTLNVFFVCDASSPLCEDELVQLCIRPDVVSKLFVLLVNSDSLSSKEDLLHVYGNAVCRFPGISPTRVFLCAFQTTDHRDHAFADIFARNQARLHDLVEDMDPVSVLDFKLARLRGHAKCNKSMQQVLDTEVPPLMAQLVPRRQQRPGRASKL